MRKIYHNNKIEKNSLSDRYSSEKHPKRKTLNFIRQFAAICNMPHRKEQVAFQQIGN